MKETIYVYTDGACKGNPGKGGWGWVAQSQLGHTLEDFAGIPNTTNNQMELEALCQALHSLYEVLDREIPYQLEVYTDSSYCMKGITEWSKNWKRNGWKTSAGKPVKNQEAWKRLDQLVEKRPRNIEINFHWIKAHAGHPGNERADQLANKGVNNV